MTWPQVLNAALNTLQTIALAFFAAAYGYRNGRGKNGGQ